MDKNIERKIDSLVTSAPELNLRVAVTNQPFSWDSNLDQPISLAEYLHSQATDIPGIELLPEISSNREVRRIEQLTNEEVRKLTMARLTDVPEVQQHPWSNGDEVWTYQEIVESARRGSGIGIRFLEADEEQLHFLQSLIDAKKVRIDDRPLEELKIPPMPF